MCDVARIADRVEPVLHRLHRLQAGHLLQRAIEAERLVAAEPVAIAEPLRQQLVERGGQLRQVPAQAVVAKQRIDHRLQLRTLLGGHRAKQRLHRSHPLGQLLDDVVEIPRPREESAVLLEELARIRVATREAFLEEAVQVTDHVAVRRQVLGRDALDRVREAAHELVEDLPLELGDEPVEAVARLRLEEVVLLQSADPAAQLGWQRVELVETLRRHVAQHVS